MATVEKRKRGAARTAGAKAAVETDGDAVAAGATADDAAKSKPARKDSRRLEKTREPGIFKRPKKKGHSYVVIVRDQRGHQIKRYAETWLEATNAKSELKSEISKGHRRATTQMPFVEYAQAWIETYKGRTSKGLKPQTKLDYEAALSRTEFKDFFRGLRLADVEPEHLIKYADELAKGGLSARTIRNLIAPLRLCLATAAERRHILFNPVAGVKVVSAMGASKRARAMTEPEITSLLEAFDRLYSAKTTGPGFRAQLPTHRLLAEFLIQTGLRIGEALALVWSDFTPDFSHVRIERRIYKGDEGAPKSDYSIRKVPLSPLMAARLREHRGKALDTDYVFPAPGGDALEYHAARRVLRRVSKTAKVKAANGSDAGDLSWIGFHTFRHTCASWLFRAPSDSTNGRTGGLGANAVQAQLWLGHHSPAFTLATYVHLMPEDLPDPAGLDHLIGANPGRSNGGATRGATRGKQTGANDSARKTPKAPANAANRKT